MTTSTKLEPATVSKKVQPQYPAIAVLGRVQGPVVVEVFLNDAGEVVDVVVESGHPVLVDAATDCVRQWEFRAAILNGKPVRSSVRVTVHFVLNFGNHTEP